ncbi:unnamed protein product, partial [Rhizoctonia solani]
MQSPTPHSALGVNEVGAEYLMIDVTYPLQYLLNHYSYSLNDAIHFTEQQNGKTHIFCWSRSNHSDKKGNYIWRVFLSGSDVRLQLQCYIEHWHLPCIAGSYAFRMDPADSDERQVFRVIQLHSTTAPYYLPLIMHTGIFPDDYSIANWNTPGSEFISDSELPSQYPSLSTTCKTAFDATAEFDSVDSLSTNSNSTTSMTASGSNPTIYAYPQVQVPNTSSYHLSAPSSNATMSETYHHSLPTAQSMQSPEIPLMSVPPGLNTKGLIDTFVRDYTSQLPKSVREVYCSLCPVSVEPWETKPTNLTRHIMAHNGVKWFQCPYPNCPRGAVQFTTKDQGKKHLEKYHVGTNVTELIKLHQDLVFNVQGSR